MFDDIAAWGNAGATLGQQTRPSCHVRRCCVMLHDIAWKAPIYKGFHVKLVA